jgi:hypothetical protein
VPPTLAPASRTPASNLHQHRTQRATWGEGSAYDRLGRSLPHLIETVAGLEQRDVGFRSLTEAIDTTTPGGWLVFLFVCGARLVRARPDPRALPCRACRRRGGRSQGRAQGGGHGREARTDQGDHRPRADCPRSDDPA